jgi:hypothetical protein
MYPSRFTKFFKKFNLWWFATVIGVVLILSLAFMLTLFLS